MKPVSVAAACTALALLTFFQFPGHTWLHQDSQIYVPILEHLQDSTVLKNDVLVQQPHVTFTLYDEAALLLRRVTGLGFQYVLELEQIAARALGIWGLYLMTGAAGLAAWPALLAAAIVSLGATIVGPAVLTFEYEPIPRGLAVLLQVCAMGLVSRGRYFAAGVAGAAGFLIHPPTVYPFWGIYTLFVLWPAKSDVRRRRLSGFWPLLVALVILAVAVRFQAGEGESQTFFSRLTPLQEKLQRLRASYVWISMWGGAVLPHYVAECAILTAAYLRIRRRLPFDMRFFAIGLPLVGLLSLPVSYVLLERMSWALIPQFQPMRALLFVTLIMQVLAAIAAVMAGSARRYGEAFCWFAAAYVTPLVPRLDMAPGWNRVAAVVLLAALATAAVWRGRAATMCGAALAGFWIVPLLGGVTTYPRLHTPEIAQLSEWARASTSKDAVFLFPYAGRGLDPGIFRSRALRALYVDWKGGGQVNYLRQLGEQWWWRWQLTMTGTAPDFAQYRTLGIQYVVVPPQYRMTAGAPDFENAKYVVYRVR